MSLRKSFIVFLMALLLIGTMYPTSSYALSDQSDAIITTESSAENVDVFMEESAVADDEYLDLIDPDIHEEPEGVDEDVDDAQTVTEDTYEEDFFTPQAMAFAEEQVIVMYPGDSYSFTNNGIRSRSLSTDAATSRSSSYDYAVYKTDGSISTDNMNSTSSLSVGAGYTAVVTSSGSNAFTVTIPAEFTYSVSANPALHKATLSKGESYRFVNEGTQTRAVSADTSTAQDRRYDYANYNEDGSLSSSNFESTGKPYLGEEMRSYLRGPEHSLSPLDYLTKYILVNGVMNQPMRVRLYIRARATSSPISVPNQMRSKVMVPPKISMTMSFIFQMEQKVLQVRIHPLSLL